MCTVLLPPGGNPIAVNKYIVSYIYIYIYICNKKVNQFHYRPEVPRGFQGVKVPRLRGNGPELW